VQKNVGMDPEVETIHLSAGPLERSQLSWRA
jgi:hypothetical protein